MIFIEIFVFFSYWSIYRADDVINQMSTKYGWGSITQHLELSEDVMGKGIKREKFWIYGNDLYLERRLRGDEKVLLSKDKWPNNNDKYCKFLLKVKRGAPEDAQMKYREALYGK